MKHTPTPWRSDIVYVYREGHRNDLVCTLHSDKDTKEANAEFIVRACNDYYRLHQKLDEKDATICELIKALEKALHLSILRSESGRKWTILDQETHEIINHALARAKGE